MKHELYGPLLLRIALGLLFLIPGLMKLQSLVTTGTHMLVGMIGLVLVWILALVEVIAGASLLVGWMTRIMVWPLVAVMLGAIFMAVIPGRADNPMWIIDLLFHLVAIAGLVSLYLTGPGAYAQEK